MKSVEKNKYQQSSITNEKEKKERAEMALTPEINAGKKEDEEFKEG